MIKNKKCISAVITTLLILFVSIVVLSTMDSWYTNLTEGVAIKNTQRLNLDEDKFYIETLTNNTPSTQQIYIRNKNKKYVILEEIKINKEKCSIINSNVVDIYELANISIECPNISKVNDILIITEGYLIERRQLLK